MTAREAESLLSEVAAKLGEYFDAVQIMATWNEDGLTKASRRGVGNWYARQGMAHEFIQQDIAQEQALQIADRLRRDDDEGDDWKAGKHP